MPKCLTSPQFASFVHQCILICRLCFFCIPVLSVPITGVWYLTLIYLFVHCFAFEKATRESRR